MTFPVDSEGSGTVVATPQGGRWDATRRMLVWPLAGHHAQIVGGQGNSGTLAWESAPGEVTYLGFSGGATDADAIESLRALANRGRMLIPAQWETKDRIPASSQRG